MKAKVHRIQRGHCLSFVIVWWGASWNKAAAIHFYMPGVKITAKARATRCDFFRKFLGTIPQQTLTFFLHHARGVIFLARLF